MATAKTSGNPPETLSDTELILKHLAHIDEGVHEVERQLAANTAKLDAVLAFIEEHRPALARGLSLMDSGAKVRAMLGRKAKP
jgi:hypothetical protein